MFVNIIYMYSYFIPYFYANIVNKVLIIIIIIIGAGAFLKFLQHDRENSVL